MSLNLDIKFLVSVKHILRLYLKIYLISAIITWRLTLYYIFSFSYAGQLLNQNNFEIPMQATILIPFRYSFV